MLPGVFGGELGILNENDYEGEISNRDNSESSK